MSIWNQADESKLSLKDKLIIYVIGGISHNEICSVRCQFENSDLSIYLGGC